MTANTVLALYSAIIIAVSLLGGWLPSKVKLTHTGTQVIMSFVAGLMLGIAFYHLLPHAIFTLPEQGGVDTAIWWLMIGLLFMFVLLRAFHFHNHGPQEEGHHRVHEHSQRGANAISWVGVALGLIVHTLIDGIALGAAIQAGAMDDATLGLLGFGVFVAIALHKPLDAMSISSLMMAGGWSAKSRFIVNILFSMMCPLGAVLFFIGIEQLGTNSSVVVGIVLAFSAGVFICISLSDLLPEVQFHSHDRTKLTIALLVGIVTAYGIGLLEPEHGRHDSDKPHYQLGDDWD